MTDIFLSYAREYLERVRQVATALEDAGLEVFWDRTIPVGKTWMSHIGEALTEARAVIVLWSEASVRRR